MKSRAGFSFHAGMRSCAAETLSKPPCPLPPAPRPPAWAPSGHERIDQASARLDGNHGHLFKHVLETGLVPAA